RLAIFGLVLVQKGQVLVLEFIEKLIPVNVTYTVARGAMTRKLYTQHTAFFAGFGGVGDGRGTATALFDPALNGGMVRAFFAFPDPHSSGHFAAIQGATSAL